MAKQYSNRRTGIKGLDGLMRNLGKELERNKLQSLNGFVRVGILINREVMTVSPTVPLDTGNLRGSWFTEFMTDLVTRNVGMRFGFSANYAFYVHERVEGAPWGEGVVGKVNWNEPGSGPKFLEAALKRNTDRILQIMAEEIGKR
jgi:hypothetical protein